MALLPFTCKHHGETLAYTHTRLSGRQAGALIQVCQQCRAAEVKRAWAARKRDVIEAYGGKCSCCGEAEPRFLTIDHINGDGRQHRREVGRGYKLYDWLTRQGYPRDGFRLLCFNCNCARGQFGTCPHEG